MCPLFLIEAIKSSFGCQSLGTDKRTCFSTLICLGLYDRLVLLSATTELHCATTSGKIVYKVERLLVPRLRIIQPSFSNQFSLRVTVTRFIFVRLASKSRLGQH